MLTRSKRLKQEQLTREDKLTRDDKLTREDKLTNDDKLTTDNNLTKESTQNILEVNIDFDEAIREWRSNKKSIGNGQYKYICPIIVKGNACGRSCYKSEACCWIHRNKIN